MFCLAGLVCVSYYTQLLNAASVRIDGQIDLGPEWSFSYKIISPKSEHRHENEHDEIEKFAEDNTHSTKLERHKKTKTGEIFVTKLFEDFKSQIYSNPKEIKEDKQINYFTTHIYKQTLKVFDALRVKMNEREVKKQIDFLSKNYESKFKEFLNDTKKHKMKTRLGPQKVILNNIDTSNRILTRLINYLIGDLDKRGILRNHLATANIFQKEVEKETQMEFDHACKRYGICRSENSFTDHLSEVMAIIVKTDDKQFKQAIDAFTEAFKNTDFSESMDILTETKLKEAFVRLERFDNEMLRALMKIASNIINNKNRPLIIHNRAGARVNQTLALLELFDILDNIPKTEANTLERDDTKSSFQQWADGKRNDILEIMESFVGHFKKSLASLHPETQLRIEIILNMIL